MSGPKDHNIELERRRQAELERLRQERLRKIREETDRLNKEVSKIRTQFDGIERIYISLTQNIENFEEMKNTVSQLKEVKDSCKQKLIKAMQVNVPFEPDEISACTNRFINDTQSILSNFYNEIKPLEERIKNNDKLIEEQKKRYELNKKLMAGTDKIGEIEDFNFASAIINIENSNIKESIEERAKELLSDIENLINCESIQETDLNTLHTLANNIYLTAFGEEKGFKAAEAQYKVIKPGIIKNIELFNDVYQDYYAEYIVCEELKNNNFIISKNIIPREKYDFDSIIELEMEAKRISQESKSIQEKNYIRSQIDSVMEEFGYNVSKEIVFSDSQKGNHFIFKKDSDNTGIHVYLSDNKQIMMQIVGVDTIHEDSNFGVMVASQDLESSEQDKLLQEQGNFCNLHPQIIEELGKRGVVFNIKSKKEPNIKYSKKIVITNEVSNKNEDKATVQNNIHVKNKATQKKAKLRTLKYGGS